MKKESVARNEESTSIDTPKAPKVKHTVRLPKGLVRFFGELIHYNTGSHPRIWELDLFRGVLMLFVTLDHVINYGFVFGFFDFHTKPMMWFAENVLKAYRDGYFRVGIQPFGLFTFSFLSGISCSLAGNNAKRSIKMIVLCAVYMGVFAILHLIMPDVVTSFFIFNIINVLTICILFWNLLAWIRTPHWIRTVLGLIMGVVGLTFYYIFFVRGISFIDNDFLSLLVYNAHAMNIVQNFEPLLPHMGFFFLGGVLGSVMYADRKTKTKSEVCIKPLLPVAMMGKNSLVTYLFLPVILLGFIWVVEQIVWLFV